MFNGKSDISYGNASGDHKLNLLLIGNMIHTNICSKRIIFVLSVFPDYPYPFSRSIARIIGTWTTILSCLDDCLAVLDGVAIVMLTVGFRGSRVQIQRRRWILKDNESLNMSSFEKDVILWALVVNLQIYSTWKNPVFDRGLRPKIIVGHFSPMLNSTVNNLCGWKRR